MNSLRHLSELCVSAVKYLATKSHRQGAENAKTTQSGRGDWN
jgi:hypothetical protein